ncbi:SDR family NAD(P)-dependent oxidoreductase [Methylobacterium sp. M6A4_1b]
MVEQDLGHSLQGSHTIRLCQRQDLTQHPFRRANPRVKTAQARGRDRTRDVLVGNRSGKRTTIRASDDPRAIGGRDIMRHRKTRRDQVMGISWASRGIGPATARMAARAGVRVVLADRSGETRVRSARDIGAQGGHAVAVAADLGKREKGQPVADHAITAVGGFDIWISVAGLTIDGPLSEGTDADFEVRRASGSTRPSLRPASTAVRHGPGLTATAFPARQNRRCRRPL